MIFRAKASRRRGSVITFTTHKAGSMVLHRVLREICALNQIKLLAQRRRKSAALRAHFLRKRLYRQTQRLLRADPFPGADEGRE